MNNTTTGREAADHPKKQVRGQSDRTATPGRDPAEECLAKLLRPFFPSHVGTSNRYQARGYTRTSAIGRGNYPPGSPAARALIAALESVGFSQRSHQGHLQAPWGHRGGRGSVGVRNEMLSFLRDGSQGPSVVALLTRIRDDGRWALDAAKAKAIARG